MQKFENSVIDKIYERMQKFNNLLYIRISVISEKNRQDWYRYIISDILFVISDNDTDVPY